MGCTHPGCGAAASSWRAFRCQTRTCASGGEGQQANVSSGDTSDQLGQPAYNDACNQQQYPPLPHEIDPFSTSFDYLDAPRVDVGIGVVFEEGTAGASQLDNNFDFSDIGAVLEECAAKQLHQLQQGDRHGPLRSGRNAQTGASKGGQVEADVQPVPSMQLPMAGPPLPEFHIRAVEEPAGEKWIVLGDCTHP